MSDSSALPAPLLYESHAHTPLCRHAVGEPGEYAAIAEARNLKGLIITCHAPLPDGYAANVRMTPEQYPVYLDLVAQAREEWQGRVDVRLGLESDYYPGVEPWLEKLHARAPLHHVLGSVHPQMADYRKDHYSGDNFLYQQTYYDHLARAAETGLYDTLAHPDLIKNESPSDWAFDRLRPWVERALDRIAATGVAMELNTSGLHKAIKEMNPNPHQLHLMCERGIPVVLGADAHIPQRVAADYELALNVLEEVGYREIHFFLGRERQTVSIPDARASLRPLPSGETTPGSPLATAAHTAHRR